jgi:hypothetical protein
VARAKTACRAAVAACLVAAGVALGAQAPRNMIDLIAQEYVVAVLALGVHDPAFVDAYYGPPEWKANAERIRRPLDSIRLEGIELGNMLDAVPPQNDPLVRLRLEYLRKQAGALRTRAEMLLGARLSFDQESAALYDAVAPSYPDAYFQDALDALDQRLPGTGPLADRLDAFRQAFTIPRDRLSAVFDLAIAECRRRTLERVSLPAGERFTVEYVTNKSWSGYNWYQGGYRSLIQVNTDLPIYIDRAVDLACHEGYPGHHVYNVLIEERLVRGRGWQEMTVYPLFSPQSLIAEGQCQLRYRDGVSRGRTRRLRTRTAVSRGGAGCCAGR